MNKVNIKDFVIQYLAFISLVLLSRNKNQHLEMQSSNNLTKENFQIFINIKEQNVFQYLNK